MEKLCFLILLCLPLSLIAQVKANSSIAVWPEIQVGMGVGEAGILFLRNQYRINSDNRFNDLQSKGPLSGFERVEVSLGYEHEVTDHWRTGGILRYAAEDNVQMIFYSAFLRHNGLIKEFFFNKQIQLDYISQEKVNPSAQSGFKAELGRVYRLGGKNIVPAISYEAFLTSDLKKDKNNISENRFIDRTQLKLNITYEFSDKLRLSPYFNKQTKYYYVLVAPVYNNQGQLEQDGFTTKLNRVYPMLGLELKYTIKRTVSTASITY
jgi:hypothetical protein